MTVLLVVVVCFAVLVGVGSRLNQSRLGGRNVRAHRRALGRLASITADQPDRVEADVSQAHLHVRLVDDHPSAPDDAVVLDLRDGPVQGAHEVHEVHEVRASAPETDPVGMPAPAPAEVTVPSRATGTQASTVPPEPPTTPSTLPSPSPSLGGTTLRALEDQMASLADTEVEVSPLPTGAVAALTRLGPTEPRSRRRRRRAARRR